MAGWIIPILKKRGSHSFPSFASNVFVRLVHSSVKQRRLGLKFWSDFYIIPECLGWIMLTNLMESKIVCFSSSFSCHLTKLLKLQILHVFLFPLPMRGAASDVVDFPRRLSLTRLLTAKFPASSFLLHDDNEGDGD